MRVARREQDFAQSLHIGVGHDRVHHLFRDTLSTMLHQNEDVAEPSERRLIGHDTCEGHLWRAPIGVAGERGKADRSVDRALYDVARDPRRPVRLVGTPLLGAVLAIIAILWTLWWLPAEHRRFDVAVQSIFDARPEAVAAVMFDISEQPRWMDSIVRTVLETPGLLRKGSVIRQT